MTITKRLYRSREDKIVAGVCGGMGEYFNIDPVWVRIIFVLLSIIDGIGILIYIIAWILMPLNPIQKITADTFAEKTVNKLTKKIRSKHSANKTHESHNVDAKTGKVIRRDHSGALLFGTILVVVGLAFLMKYFFSSINLLLLWPIIIIVIGMYLVFRKVD